MEPRFPGLPESWPPDPEKSPRNTYIMWAVVAFAAIVVAVVITAIIVREAPKPIVEPLPKAPAVEVPRGETPEVNVETILSGRQHVWDLAFLPDKSILFTERKGTLNVWKDGKTRQVAAPSDVRVAGEGGMLGLAIDPSFGQNHYVYMCFNSTQGDVRVGRFQLKADLSGVDKRIDIVRGIPANSSGRHSGCRVAFGPDNYLWVATGDSAQGASPSIAQSPKSLGGKILRVDREGRPVLHEGTPGFDPRVYSYGHRNTQGIVFFPSSNLGVVGLSVEHGSTVDDEVNPLKPGNFGWAPPDNSYDETNVPMTDKKRFPDAVDAIWSSGSPTQAPSGATYISGEKWKGWDGAIAIAMLKAEHLKVLRVDDQLKVTQEDRKLEGGFGRLRAVVQGPDNNLYVATDSGNDSRILRVSPKE